MVIILFNQRAKRQKVAFDGDLFNNMASSDVHFDKKETSIDLITLFQDPTGAQPWTLMKSVNPYLNSNVKH